MKRLFIILFMCALAVHSNAQIKGLLKRVKQESVDRLKSITTEDVVDAGKKVTIKYLEESRNNYDQTDFNYAVSFSDNSGIYESEEKYRRYQKGILYLISPESLENRTSEQKAEDYNDVGEVLYASNKFKSAEASFMAAYLIHYSEDQLETKRGALVLSNLGLLYHTTGRLSKAEESTTSALETRRNINDRDGVGASMNNLGVLYKDLGRYTEAEELIRKSAILTAETKGEASSAYAIVLNNQAIINQVLGNYDGAEQMLLKAIEIAGNELKEKSTNYVRLKVNLAMLYQLQNRLEEAEEIYLDAIAIKKNRLGTNHPDYAVLLKNLASIYFIQGYDDKVEQNLNQSLAIYKNKFGENHHAYAGALADLGNFRLFMGETKEAYPLLSKALSIQRSKLGNHHPSYVNTLENIAILEWQEGDWTRATEDYRKVMSEYIYQINTLFPAMSENDKSRFWGKIHPKFIRFYSYALEASQQDPTILEDMYNYHIATKALLLSSTSKVKDQILNSGDTDLISRYNDWLDLKEYLAKLYTLSREELAENEINLDSLEQASNQKERELSRMSDLFSQGYEVQQITTREITEHLSDNEGCLEIIRIQRYEYLSPGTDINYAALVLGKNSPNQPYLALFRDGYEMENSSAKRYREAMQRGFEGEPFYDVYWKDLEAATNDYSTIYASFDGVYNQINLNTLQKRSGSFLIDEKNLISVTNTRDLLKIKEKRSIVKAGKKEAFLIGNPDYDAGFDMSQMKYMPLPELPGTQIEVDLIEAQLKSAGYNTQKYSDVSASEDQIKAVQSPAILHIATHGFFLEDLPAGVNQKVFGIEPIKAAENPLLRSGLLFTGADNTLQQIKTTGSQRADDGVLNAFEAMVLDLDQTILVVLSACETGLGEIINGEGVYGLQRSFQIAGASSIIISLWQVSDEVTQELMTRFYRYWLTGGDKQKAFIRAQLEIKQKFPAPFYWGAFVMVN